MGAEPYWYFVPYESDVNSALQKLREREFKAGRYHPALSHLDFPLTASSPSPGARHPSIDAARRAARENGTRSILDIETIGPHSDFGVAGRLDDEELEALYGTTQPTHQMVEDNPIFTNPSSAGKPLMWLSTRMASRTSCFSRGIRMIEKQRGWRIAIHMRTKVLVTFVVLALIVSSVFLIEPILTTPGWHSAGPSSTDPAKFFVLVFPRNEHVPLLSSEGKPAGRVFSRAAIMSLGELGDSSHRLIVFVGSDPFSVDKDQIIYACDNPRRAACVAALNQELVQWGQDTDWKHVFMDVRAKSDGSTHVELRLDLKRGSKMRFDYSLKNGKVVPIAVSVKR